MRAKTILTLCCFLCLLLTGATLFAEPAPALPLSLTSPAAPAAVCPAAAPAVENAAPVMENAQPLSGGVTNLTCSATTMQACVKRYGQCAICRCITSCFCENNCGV